MLWNYGKVLYNSIIYFIFHCFIFIYLQKEIKKKAQKQKMLKKEYEVTMLKAVSWRSLFSIILSVWCHKLEFWHLIYQLWLLRVTPWSDRLPLEWMMKWTKPYFATESHIKITPLNSWTVHFWAMLSCSCISRKYHYVKSKYLRQKSEHSTDIP